MHLPARINTSNLNKLREFRALGFTEVEALAMDLPEPDSDPITVIRFKASQFAPERDVLVEDTSFEVEGFDVGVNIRWMMGNLGSMVGHRARVRVLLGIHRDNRIHIYEGIVRGSIAPPSGKGFGFDPFFLPEGASETWGVNKPLHSTARAMAVRNFISNTPILIASPLLIWSGDFQHA